VPADDKLAQEANVDEWQQDAAAKLVLAIVFSVFFNFLGDCHNPIFGLPDMCGYFHYLRF
jgi:hypothetical protein